MGSLKNVLKKSSARITELHLAEITFAIKAHVSSEGTGSNNDRFLVKLSFEYSMFGRTQIFVSNFRFEFVCHFNNLLGLTNIRSKDSI